MSNITDLKEIWYQFLAYVFEKGYTPGDESLYFLREMGHYKTQCKMKMKTSPEDGGEHRVENV